jgi:hypothetical protein
MSAALEPEDTLAAEMRAAFAAASIVSVSLLDELASISLPRLTESVQGELTAHGLTADSEAEQILIRATVASTYARVVESLALAVHTA